MKENSKGLKIGIIICACVIAIATVAIVTVVLMSSGGKKIDKQLALGQKYLDEMEYEEAIACFEKALEIDPLCVEAYLGIADAYIELEDYDSAMKILIKAKKKFEKAAKKDDSKSIKKALKLIEEKAEEVENLNGVSEVEPDDIVPEPDSEPDETPEEEEVSLPPMPEYDYSNIKDPFSLFAGEYEFSSGAGGWGTDLTVKPDGSFEVEFHDANMGEYGTDHENGTVYLAAANGTFKNIERVDEFTFRATVDDMAITTPVGTEEIEDDILYVYTDGVYGFENGTIEFCLPGKQVHDINDECASWLFLGYDGFWPATIVSPVVCNLSCEAGFVSWDYDDKYNIGYAASSVPESISVAQDSNLSGTYTGTDGSVMYIDINGYGVETGSGYIGNISYDESKFKGPENRSLLVVGKDTDGYYVVPYYYSDYNNSYNYSEYNTLRIMVSDSTPGSVILGIYSVEGRWFNTYTMN